MIYSEKGSKLAFKWIWDTFGFAFNYRYNESMVGLNYAQDKSGLSVNYSWDKSTLRISATELYQESLLLYRTDIN